MNQDTANWIAEQMQRELSTRQLRLLREVMELAIARSETSDDIDAVGLFLRAKEVEGCSPKTIAYYESTLNRMIKELAIPATKIRLFGGFCGRDSGIGPAQRAKTTIWN